MWQTVYVKTESSIEHTFRTASLESSCYVVLIPRRLQNLTRDRYLLTKFPVLATVVRLPRFEPMALEHDWSMVASSSGWLWRLYVQNTRVLAMYIYTKSSHFFLYGRKDCDDGREGVLVFGHQAANVVDVCALSDVILDVALNMLQAHVEDS